MKPLNEVNIELNISQTTTTNGVVLKSHYLWKHNHQQHINCLIDWPGQRLTGKKGEMKEGWICCITAQALPTFSLLLSPLYVPSLPSIAHHWHRVGNAAAKVTDGQYPPPSALSRTIRAKLCSLRSWLSGHDRLWIRLLPLLLSRAFYPSEGKKVWAQEEQLYIICCEAQDLKNKGGSSIIYHKRRNPSGSGLTG